MEEYSTVLHAVVDEWMSHVYDVARYFERLFIQLWRNKTTTITT